MIIPLFISITHFDYRKVERQNKVTHPEYQQCPNGGIFINQALKVDNFGESIFI